MKDFAYFLEKCGDTSYFDGIPTKNPLQAATDNPNKDACKVVPGLLKLSPKSKIQMLFAKTKTAKSPTEDAHPVDMKKTSPTNEEVIAELSKNKLGSYISKAASSLYGSGVSQGVEIGNDKFMKSDKSKEAMDTSKKRTSGIVTAVYKLKAKKTNEDLVNELSVKTLKSYAGKRAADVYGNSLNAASATEYAKDAENTAQKTQDPQDWKDAKGWKSDADAFNKRSVDGQLGLAKANRKIKAQESYSDDLKQVMNHSAVTGQDNRDLSRKIQGNDSTASVPRVSKFAFPTVKPALVQKKSVTPFKVSEEVTTEFILSEALEPRMVNPSHHYLVHKDTVISPRGIKGGTIGGFETLDKAVKYGLSNKHIMGTHKLMSGKDIRNQAGIADDNTRIVNKK